MGEIKPGDDPGNHQKAGNEQSRSNNAFTIGFLLPRPMDAMSNQETPQFLRGAEEPQTHGDQQLQAPSSVQSFEGHGEQCALEVELWQILRQDFGDTFGILCNAGNSLRLHTLCFQFRFEVLREATEACHVRGRSSSWARLGGGSKLLQCRGEGEAQQEEPPEVEPLDQRQPQLSKGSPELAIVSP